MRRTALGLLANVFTAVVVSRTMFELTFARGRRVTLGSAWLGRLLGRGPIDLMAYRTGALWTLGAVIVAGLTVSMVRGLPRGPEFTSGTAVVAEFDGQVNEGGRPASDGLPRDSLPSELRGRRGGRPQASAFPYKASRRLHARSAAGSL
jgi:hypothetical protein